MSGQQNHAEPPLSIVIPSHRRADLLRACLNSVMRHAPPDTQVIVVDDASADSCISRTAREFPGVEVERLTRNSGFCVAVNRGLQLARAPIVELLNDDTEVVEGWADAAIACFEDPRVVAVAPLVLRKVELKTEMCVDSAGDTYHIGGFAQKRASGLHANRVETQPIEVFGASASSAFYRRDALVVAGGMSEDFDAYFEDVDLSFRLRHAGGIVLFAPQSQVYHRVHASYGAPNRRLLEQQSRNEERVFWRNLPAGFLARALPWHCAAIVAKAWRRLLEGTLPSFVIGRLRALAEMPALLRQRQLLIARSSQTVANWPIHTGWRVPGAPRI